MIPNAAEATPRVVLTGIVLASVVGCAAPVEPSGGGSALDTTKKIWTNAFACVLGARAGK